MHIGHASAAPLTARARGLAADDPPAAPVGDPRQLLDVDIDQLTRPGVDPPGERALPAWYRWGLGANSLIALGFGVALFLAPGAAGSVWPWALTPLTARAIAAWLVGLGLVLAQAGWENAWERIRVATGSYAVLGVLQFAALARYPHAKGIDWGAARIWLYVALVANVVGMGAYGWVASRSERRVEPSLHLEGPG